MYDCHGNDFVPAGILRIWKYKSVLWNAVLACTERVWVEVRQKGGGDQSCAAYAFLPLTTLGNISMPGDRYRLLLETGLLLTVRQNHRHTQLFVRAKRR